MGVILISASITFGLFFILLLVVSKKGQSRQSPLVSTPLPSASPAPTHQPKSKQNWLGGLVLAGVTIAVIIWIYVGVSGMMSQATTAKVGPVWGEIQTLTLTDQPTIVPWPKGAISSLTHLASHEKGKGRKFKLVSGNREFIFGDEEPKAKVIIGKPYKITSVDGKPLDITNQWKFSK